MLHVTKWCEKIGSRKMFHKKEGWKENATKRYSTPPQFFTLIVVTIISKVLKAKLIVHKVKKLS
jgi:hypothetical protein